VIRDLPPDPHTNFSLPEGCRRQAAGLHQPLPLNWRNTSPKPPNAVFTEAGKHELSRGGQTEEEVDRRVAVGPRQFGVDLRDYQPRTAERRVQMLDAEPGIVPPRFVRAADLQQHDVDRQQPTGYQATNIGNICWDDVVGAAGEKPPPGAGPPNAVTVTLGGRRQRRR
jgi:hypothetical protein